MIHTLTAELVISAPLITAGHSPLAKNDLIRPSAIKGALRFWWRAIQWQSIRRCHPCDNDALTALHQAESRLFGSAAGNSGHQAKVLLRLDAQQRLDNEAFAKGKDLAKIYPGAVYLLGQGQHQRNSGTQCAGLQATGPVKLKLCWRADTLDQAEQESVIKAVQALGLLGSLGARARKGFGSLSLQTLTLDRQSLPVPANTNELSNWFAGLSRDAVTELPPFTAISTASRCWVLGLKPARDPLALLNEYGLQMMQYRLSDKSALPGGQPGRGLFKSDARSLRGVIDDGRPGKAPQRAVFGLPNNVFFVDNKQTVEVNPGKHERRASPLFAHLHRFPSGEQVLLATLVPARFLPDGEGLSIKHKGKRFALPFTPDWSVIEGFIKQCGGEELTR